MFQLNWPVLMIIPQDEGQLVQLVSLNKVLTVSMSQIVVYVVITNLAELASGYLNWVVLMIIP